MTQRRRSSARRLSYGGEARAVAPRAPDERTLHINDLPDALLIEIFRQLAQLPPVTTDEEQALYARGVLPFRTFEYPGEVHPGLRAYPFLAQVCRHWKGVLESREALPALWQDLVVDFAHELITGVHVPVRWSDVRPSDEEFREAFAAVRLQSHRVVDFVRERHQVLRRLTLTNSEGYWADDGEFVAVASKHTFNLGTLGILLGMLSQLQELSIVHCNDLFSSGSPLSTIAMLRGLRSLTLEDLQCRIYREPLAELGRLTQLTALAVNSTQRHGVFVFGIDCIPDTWKQLGNLRSLELRGNALLESLPDWLPGALPHLESLDVSACSRLDLRSITAWTQLTTLSLQAMDLVWGAAPPRLLTQAQQHGIVARVKQLPDLSPLRRLAALNLADNNLAEVPPWLLKMSGLEVLDLSGNFFLECQQPLNQLQTFKRLRWLDMRAVHVEADTSYWSPPKCTTMQNIAAVAKLLRRRNRHVRVMYDTS
jgi:hypothetical protein